MTTENNTCNYCSRSTESSECPSCQNEQFCEFCNQCNICGAKPRETVERETSLTTDPDPQHLFHISGIGLATYIPPNYAEAILRQIDGRSLSRDQKADLQTFYDAMTLRLSEYKGARS